MELVGLGVVRARGGLNTLLTGGGFITGGGLTTGGGLNKRDEKLAAMVAELEAGGTGSTADGGNSGLARGGLTGLVFAVDAGGTIGGNVAEKDAMWSG